MRVLELAVTIIEIYSCGPGTHGAYGTSVVLLRCQFVPEIRRGEAPEVFLISKAGTSPYDLYCVGVT
jgi:hypothetical protein